MKCTKSESGFYIYVYSENYSETMQCPVINIEDIPSSIKEFFSAEEFATISDYEKQTYSNLRQNFEVLRRAGFPVDPPEFMLKNKSVKEKNRLINPPFFDSSDGSDSEWTPALERAKKPQANKRKTLYNPPKKVCSENDASDITKTLMSSKSKKRKEKQTEIESEEEDIHIYPFRKKRMTSYMSLAIPDDEDFLYCEECNQEYDGDCPFHGALLSVHDAEVSLTSSSNSLDYCKRTLPDGLAIKKSLIPKAGLGVFAIKDFPARSRFGPYRGKKERNEEIAHESGYSWQVMRDGQTSYFVDARDPAESNWMRFVNCARHEDEQCVTAYQYKGEVYYRSHKQIFAGAEILVYYGESYAKDLGIQIKQFGKGCRKVQEQVDADRPVINKDNDKIYSCTKCHLSFSEFCYLHKHMKYKHGDSSLQLQPNEILLPVDKSGETEIKMNQQHSCVRDTTSEIDNDLILIDISNSTENINKNQIVNMSILQNKICNGDLNKTFSLNDKHVTPDRSDLNDKKCIDKESNITKHKRKKCDVHLVELTSSSCHETHKRIHTGEKPYKCDVCGVGFTHSGNLLGHKRIHTGEKPYKCDVCGVGFTHSGHLLVHKRIHTGEKPYKCDVCGVVFTQSGSLLGHKRIHTGEKPYKCDVCGVGFTQRGHLLGHKRIHTGEKPYKCDVCSVGFTQRGHLLGHKRIHTGEKPYKCDVCSVGFTQRGHLLGHKRIHTGEKPYKCDVCSVGFTQRGHLLGHKRIHTGEKPYKCDVCGVEFTQQGHLLVHKRIHTGEKPYKCDVCGVEFTQQGHLLVHKRIHTGEKPYKCDVCGVTFTHSESLKQHKKKHTGH